MAPPVDMQALLRRQRIRMTPNISDVFGTPDQVQQNPDQDAQWQLLQQQMQQENEARFAPRQNTTATIAPINTSDKLKSQFFSKGDISAPYQRQADRANSLFADQDYFRQLQAQANAAYQQGIQGANAGAGYTPPTGTDIGSRIVAAAMKELGIPYSWGGGGAKGPSRGIKQGANTVGFDCSGLVQYAYAQVGLKMPRVSYGQLQTGSRSAIKNLRPGDLVGFGNGHHIAIYLGNGKIIEAPHTGAKVRIRNIGKGENVWGVKVYH